jgi:hypothetical protein
VLPLADTDTNRPEKVPEAVKKRGMTTAGFARRPAKIPRRTKQMTHNTIDLTSDSSADDAPAATSTGLSQKKTSPANAEPVASGTRTSNDTDIATTNGIQRTKESGVDSTLNQVTTDDSGRVSRHRGQHIAGFNRT